VASSPQRRPLEERQNAWLYSKIYLWLRGGGEERRGPTRADGNFDRGGKGWVEYYFLNIFLHAMEEGEVRPTITYLLLTKEKEKGKTKTDYYEHIYIPHNHPWSGGGGGGKERSYGEISFRRNSR